MNLPLTLPARYQADAEAFGYHRLDDATGTSVAFVYGPVSEARFVATACNTHAALLEACRVMLVACHAISDPDDWHQIKDEIQEMEAAVKKASL